MKRRAAGAIVVAVVAAVLDVVGGAPAAAVLDATTKARVTVVVTQASTDDNLDVTTDADLFVKGWIYNPDGSAAATFVSDVAESNEDEVSPSDWTFSAVVDHTGSTAIELALWDEDNIELSNPDDALDIAPGDGVGDFLVFNVNYFDPCSLTTGATGTGGVPCQVTTSSEGDSGGDDGRIEFRVTVEPVRNPLLRIYCAQEPLWPQPGQEVTITAKTYDGSLAPVVADVIEFWDDTRPEGQRVTQPTAPAETRNGVSSATHTITAPAIPGTFLYGCRARTAGALVSTQWRMVGVGQPGAAKEPIPLVVTGRQTERIDVVFAASTATGGATDFSSWSDPNFLADVKSAINTYYPDPVGLKDVDERMGGNVLIEFQDLFNFWLAPISATIPASCKLSHDADTSGLYVFLDALAILHRGDVRDCAKASTFSANAA